MPSKRLSPVWMKTNWILIYYSFQLFKCIVTIFTSIVHPDHFLVRSINGAVTFAKFGIYCLKTVIVHGSYYCPQLMGAYDINLIFLTCFDSPLSHLANNFAKKIKIVFKTLTFLWRRVQRILLLKSRLYFVQMAIMDFFFLTEN